MSSSLCLSLMATTSKTVLGNWTASGSAWWNHRGLGCQTPKKTSWRRQALGWVGFGYRGGRHARRGRLHGQKLGGRKGRGQGETSPVFWSWHGIMFCGCGMFLGLEMLLHLKTFSFHLWTLMGKMIYSDDPESSRCFSCQLMADPLRGGWTYCVKCQAPNGIFTIVWETVRKHFSK